MEPTVRKVTKHGNERWEVDFGLDEFGVRRRPVYNTEDEANEAVKAWKKEQKKYGDWWLNQSPLRRQQITIVMREIDAWRRPGNPDDKSNKITLPGVWEDWKKWEKERRSQAKVELKPYGEAVEYFRNRKLEAGKSDRYINETCSGLIALERAGRSNRSARFFPKSSTHGSRRSGTIRTPGVRCGVAVAGFAGSISLN